MSGTEIQERFMELRAENVSYDKIAKEIKVSKPTLIKWAKEFETDIANLRKINLAALHEKYKISWEHKIEMWSEQLQAIRQELVSRGYKDVPTTALVDMLERFSTHLDQEKGKLVFQGEPKQVDSFVDLSIKTKRDEWNL